MNKKGFVTSCFVMACLLSGCSSKTETYHTYANVSNQTEKLFSSKGGTLTVENVYSNMRDASNQNEVMKIIIQNILKENIDFNNQDVKNLYKKYLNEYFVETFVDSGSYNSNGKFDENKVVSYLKSESYDITNDNASDSLLDAPFTYNYNDYIEKELNYDIYLKVLKAVYIVNNKANLIDKNNARKINYYTLSSSSSENSTNRKKMEEYVKSIVDNKDSTDPDIIKDIQTIAESVKLEDLKKIDDEFEKIGTSSDSSYEYLKKYTTCGDLKCVTIEEGKEYQKQIINDKDYYTSEVVIKSNDSVLYEGAREVLFSNNVDDYLLTIGNKKYLVAPVYPENDVKSYNDIIIFNNDGSSYDFYLVDVEVINSQSSFVDKLSVAELLIDSINSQTIISECLKESNVEIYDKTIRELVISTYGDYKEEG